MFQPWNWKVSLPNAFSWEQEKRLLFSWSLHVRVIFYGLFQSSSYCRALRGIPSAILVRVACCTINDESTSPFSQIGIDPMKVFSGRIDGGRKLCHEWTFESVYMLCSSLAYRKYSLSVSCYWYIASIAAGSSLRMLSSIRASRCR